MPGKKTLVGFGFGAIQTGLFLWEAQQSGNFDRLVVVIPNGEVVAALRRHGGSFKVNIATPSGREVCEIHHVEILNSQVARDRLIIAEAIADASELTTALPSVATYDHPEVGISGLLAEGLKLKLRQPRPEPCILYAAENNNHAAEILLRSVGGHLTPDEQGMLRTLFQPLDTVIGKMSRVVRDPGEIKETGLEPYVDGGSRAYLVEAFNRILVSQVTLPGFQRGIAVFVEKDDLLPFEEAKLYGHNAAHALLGYLGRRRGLRFIAEAKRDSGLMVFVREAFLEESGRALIARRGGTDPLFTAGGFAAFADDLLQRMVNPWLLDDVDRVIRDPRRKLGWDDRFVGTMRLAMSCGIRPRRFAAGAAAALEGLAAEDPSRSKAALLDEIWSVGSAPESEKKEMSALILGADPEAV